MSASVEAGRGFAASGGPWSQQQQQQQQLQPPWVLFLRSCLSALSTPWAWEELGEAWLCIPRASAAFRCLEEGGQDSRRCAGLTDLGGLEQICDFRQAQRRPPFARALQRQTTTARPPAQKREGSCISARAASK